ncbi:MAG TPA: ribokinase [Streptosporangiaceae bacterium]|nr:ribokinase [Streptosporangiaceae bacterium]
MAQRPRVTVLGSLNTDISLPVPHLPGPGETVLAAGSATFGAGGKGANQAVAAARLGASVQMAGCCGDDEFGARLRAGLTAEGVGVAGLRALPGVASGLALITVDPAGENSIAVAPGANGLAGDAEVAAAFAQPCDVLVMSAEIPAAVLGAALRRARAEGVRTVLNLAPVPEGADGLLAECPDWLVVNAQEAAALTGRPAHGVPGQARVGGAGDAAGVPAESAGAPGKDAAGAPGNDAAGAQAVAAALAGGPGGGHVVVTLGAAGAVLAGPWGTAAVPGFRVSAVDTVAAGDAFVGALAVALASGLAPAKAVTAACAAGAAAATRRGAQAALPRPADVLAATGFTWPA